MNAKLNQNPFFIKIIMLRPLISIITVVLNDKDNIDQTIQSVLNQNYKNIEYIIIDGGSEDGTTDIVRKYNKKISHLKLWLRMVLNWSISIFFLILKHNLIIIGLKINNG